ncbi:MAG: hypothetical protein ACT4R6_00810 [Gemmatimonadaceae bacterium]
MSDSLLSMVLEPPYAAARRNTGAAPPDLGAVLLVDCVEDRPTSAQLKPITDSALWCPVCVIARDRWDVRHIRRTARVTVIFSLDDGAGATRQLLEAVAARARPSAGDLADWIVTRTKLPALRRTLIDLFSRSYITRAEALRLPWTIRSQLGLLGRWDASDWQLLGSLVDAATRSGSSVWSDLGNQAQELLGMSAAECACLAGWEWLPEVALRRAGFFSSDRSDALRDPRRVAVLDSPGLRAAAEWRGRSEFEPSVRSRSSAVRATA